MKYYKWVIIMAIAVMAGACSKPGTTSKASSVTVTTFSGSGTAGATNGTGTSASFAFPSSIVTAGSGELFIGDFGNNLIRAINISSVAVTTIAGTGTAGLLNGTGTAAKFNGTANITFDASGNLYVADEENNVIREITSAGNVTTLCGSGIAGYQDGPASSAKFDHPEGMATDAAGNLYVADGHNNVIRKIVLSTGAVSTYAGTGSAGFANGPIASATFNDPYGLTMDASGNLYVADILNNSIRKINVATSAVSTYAGTGAKGLSNGPAASATFNYPLGCIFDSFGNMYVADTYNNVIRKISSSGTVTSFAGTGTAGSTDGPASTASFNFPIGIAISGNGIFVADTHNNVIRKITIGQ
jgi:hypothetical protein